MSNSVVTPEPNLSFNSNPQNQLTTHAKARVTKREIKRATVLQLGAMIGLSALLYPSAANWWSVLSHNEELTTYVDGVDALSAEQRLNLREAATEYNQNLPSGILQDPYLVSDKKTDAAEADHLRTGGSEPYLSMLRVGDDDVIGQLSYPRLDVSLPIFHGTSEATLTHGVGHLFGSSLPVGGDSTHTVLTSHSGLVHAELFTPLHDSVVGDQIVVSSLGEELHYRVETITVVEPSQTEVLAIRQGEDWLTLITCTPIGVNSHRLIVQAERIDPVLDPNISAAGEYDQHFPWWLIIFIGASSAIALVLFAPLKRSSLKTSEPVSLFQSTRRAQRYES